MAETGRRDVLDRRLRPRSRRSGASRRSRSSSPSARSSRGPSRTSARSRRRRTRTRATAPTGCALLRDGLSAEETVERLDGRRRRPRPPPARHRRRATGARRDATRAPSAWTGPAGSPGPCFAAQGNILVGEETVDALAATFTATAGARSPSGCSTASPRRRPQAATAAASSRRRCSSSSATAATRALATRSSTCASTTTQQPIAELARLYDAARAALRQDAARRLARRRRRPRARSCASGSRGLGYDGELDERVRRVGGHGEPRGARRRRRADRPRRARGAARAE